MNILEQQRIFLQGNSNIYNYSEQDLIGTGSSSNVYKALDQNGNNVAIKVIQVRSLHQNDKYISQQLQQDFLKMKLINNRNVIQIIEIIPFKENIYIVMEYCDSGNLRQLLEKKGKLKEQEAMSLFKQIINGVQGFHQQKIMITNLKLENILISQNQNIKIVDLGFSTQLQPIYSNDECLGNTKAMGIILYQMLYGLIPEQDQYQLQNKINKINFNENPSVQKETQDFIIKILQENPDQRISFDEICQHPFFQQKDIFNSYGQLVNSAEQDQFSNMFFSNLNHDQNQSFLQQDEIVQQQQQQQEQKQQPKIQPQSNECYLPPDDDDQEPKKVNEEQLPIKSVNEDQIQNQFADEAEMRKLINQYDKRFKKIEYLLDTQKEISNVEFPNIYHIVYPHMIMQKKAMIEFRNLQNWLLWKVNTPLDENFEKQKKERLSVIKKKIETMQDYFKEVTKPYIDMNINNIRMFLKRNQLKDIFLEPSECFNENYQQGVELILSLIQTMKYNTVHSQIQTLVNLESRLKLCLDFEKFLLESTFEPMELDI